MDKYIRAWIQSPFKTPKPKKVEFRTRCEHLTDDGVKFGCAIMTGFRLGNCASCGFYKATKGA